MDSITDDLSSLYTKMAKYDFTKPIHITVWFERNGNVIRNTQIRKDYNDAIYENQLLNEIQNNQIMTNYAKNTSTQPHGMNINENNNYYNLATPTAGNINTTIANNLYSNDQTNWISDLLFGKDHPSRTNSRFNEVSSTSNNPRTNLQLDKNTAKLLFNLSVYLINLIKVYNYYLCIIKTKGISYSQITNAKKKFLDARDYYSSMSFDIVSQVILPQTYNKNFTTPFLDEIKRMIRNKTPYVTDHDITRAYNEIIRWAKNRITSSNIRPRENNHSGDCILREHTPDVQFCGSIQRYQEPASGDLLQDGQTCIFKYGCPGSEISLNVNTEILHNLNSQRQESVIKNVQIEKNNGILTENEPNVNPNTIKGKIYQNEETQQHIPERSTSSDSGFMSPCSNQMDPSLAQLSNEEMNMETKTELVAT